MPQDQQKIMVMPNELVEGQRMPRPYKDEFENFTDMMVQVKAYAKEVGFSVVNGVVEQS